MGDSVFVWAGLVQCQGQSYEWFRSGLGVVGITGVSVPATMAAANTDLQNSLFKRVSDIANSAYNKTKEKFNGFETALRTEYENAWEQGSTEVEKRPEEIYNKYQEGKQWVENNSEKVKDYAVEANYYGFTFGNIVKQVLTHIPTILTDTTIDLIYPEAKGEQNLLSIGKMIMMGNNGKMSDFVEGVKKALESHSESMGNISLQDAQGIVKVLKNVNYDDASISKFLGNVKTNSEKLDSSYSCTTKLLVHLLVGKDQISEMESKITSLTELIDQVKDSLEDIEEDAITTFKEKLEEIKKQQTNIAAICPSDTVATEEVQS